MILVVALASALAGVFWGAVRMLSGIAAVAAAFVAGRWAGPPAAALLAGHGMSASGARLAGVAVVAVAAAVLVLVAGRGLRRGLEALHLRWLDRLGGGLLAGAAATAVMALLLGLAAAGGHVPGTPWAARLAGLGQAALGFQSSPVRSAIPSSAPSAPTSSGHQSS